MCRLATRWQALTHYVLPLMHGCPVGRPCRALANGLSPVGILMGWRRGCQAAAMVRAHVHDYCLATCSPLLVFVRRSPHVSSLVGGGLVPLLVGLRPLLSLPCVPCGVCGGLPRPGVPCPHLLVRHSKWSVRSASSVRLPFWCEPYVRRAFLCSHTGGVRVSPPLPALLRPLFASSSCRALVGPF